MSSLEITGRVNSHNDWDKLREIIVGTVEGSMAVLTWMKPEPIPEEIREQAYKIARDAYPQWYVDEVAEDLEELCDVLMGFGVKVYRPEVFDLSCMCVSPFWVSTSNNLYNVRDLHLVVGNTVIESPSYEARRLFEPMAFYPIWYGYLKQGFRWIVSPKPRLDYEPRIPYMPSEKERELKYEDQIYQKLTDGRIEELYRLKELEIIFEAANTLRLGKDLLYQVSLTGNYLGAQWMQNVLGDEYRVHTVEGIYRAAHIDSTIVCLKAGFVMLNSTRVNERNCPKVFDKWDKLYFGDVAPMSEMELMFQKKVRDPLGYKLDALGFKHNLFETASPWVGMNLLSIDPKTVIVDKRQINLIKLLEQNGFMVVPISMRHIYTMSGALHCITLDTVRDSQLENYVD